MEESLPRGPGAFAALDYITRQLALKAYGSEEAYERGGYPALEGVIALYRTWLGDPNAALYAATAAGFPLPDDAELDADSYFLDTFAAYLDLNRRQLSSGPTIEAIVGMSVLEYEAFMARSFPGEAVPYEERLAFLADKYYVL